MYESPLEKIYGEIQEEINKRDEEYILTLTRNVGYNVNRDELIKALQYDRDQYKKGYNDAKKEILDKIYDTLNDIQFYDCTGYDIYCDIKEALDGEKY